MLGVPKNRMTKPLVEFNSQAAPFDTFKMGVEAAIAVPSNSSGGEIRIFGESKLIHSQTSIIEQNNNFDLVNGKISSSIYSKLPQCFWAQNPLSFQFCLEGKPGWQKVKTEPLIFAIDLNSKSSKFHGGNKKKKRR